MTMIEITFNPKGNTIVGSYSAYRGLDSAIQKKAVPSPYGHTISGEESDIRRLTEYVQLFGYCIRSIAGWRKACELGNCKMERNDLEQGASSASAPANCSAADNRDTCPKCGVTGWIDVLGVAPNKPSIYRCRACKSDWFDWPGDEPPNRV